MMTSQRRMDTWSLSGQLELSTQTSRLPLASWCTAKREVSNAATPSNS